MPSLMALSLFWLMHKAAPLDLPWAWNNHSKGQAARWGEKKEAARDIRPCLASCLAYQTTEEQLRRGFFPKGKNLNLWGGSLAVF